MNESSEPTVTCRHCKRVIHKEGLHWVDSVSFVARCLIRDRNDYLDHEPEGAG
jgi:hypothetical protein